MFLTNITTPGNTRQLELDPATLFNPDFSHFKICFGLGEWDKDKILVFSFPTVRLAKTMDTMSSNHSEI